MRTYRNWTGILVMDINRRPDLEACSTELKKLNKK